MRIKEPFLLVFALVFIVFPWLPKTLYRGRTREPYENQFMARLGFTAIGLAFLLLWYSLRSN